MFAILLLPTVSRDLVFLNRFKLNENVHDEPCNESFLYGQNSRRFHINEAFSQSSLLQHTSFCIITNDLHNVINFLLIIFTRCVSGKFDMYDKVKQADALEYYLKSVVSRLKKFLVNFNS